MEVLILDEPTSGLDPNQIVEVRDLIRTLGHNKTVILSTHIMQEVQALCQRVIIINKGHLVADEATASLRQKGMGQMAFKVEFSQEVDLQKLQNLPGVSRVIQSGRHAYRIMSAQDVRDHIFRFAVAEKLELRSLQMEEQSLEDIFSQLTKGEKP